MSEADRTVAHGEARRGVGGLLQALDRVPWINHPYRIAAAEYKPLQLQAAARVGLTIPATYVGNDLVEAKMFASKAGGPVICKPFAGQATSQDGQLHATWTTLIDPDNIDPDQFAATAHLVQAWVPKSHEARVTVVGDQVFPALIHAESEAAQIDWRSDYASLRYERSDLPSNVREGVTAYMRAFDIAYGAFDFVVRPDGTWVFLECNPAGQWGWIEETTGTPIAAALAEALGS